MLFKATIFGASLALGAFAAPTSSPVATNDGFSMTYLFQNNLNFTDDFNHVGALLLSDMRPADAGPACVSLNEALLPAATLQQHAEDFYRQLAYNAYAGRADADQQYWIAGGQVVSVGSTVGDLVFSSPQSANAKLPVLCTQSDMQNGPSAVATSTNGVTVVAGPNTYVGFRNQKSFRFQGIPFADKPTRFKFSTTYSGRGETIQATKYGPDCAQPNEGSEDCLFLNIQTPYLPRQGRRNDLRPVLFWIYGGGFTGGSGAASGSDGGQLASREDIVVVSTNYRLSTLGFLAIPGTRIRGNFGISDQVTALQWVRYHIAEFGGDPDRITIIGESAGAGSVRALLGSPKALDKFQGAISMSNLGGGVDLGLSGDYATTYSSYLTVEESYAIAGQAIFQEAGCTNATLDLQIECLESQPALKIVNLPTVARYVVQDGTYVNTENLDVVNKNGSAAYVPVIFGNVKNDGASFSTYPKTPVTTQVEGIMASLGISEAYANDIINSGLFPYYDTGNVTLDSFNVSQRVATDNQFLCIDQATMYAGFKSGAFPSTYYYQMQRSSNGYDPNALGGPPVEPGFPNGNPSLPYFKLHGADMPWVFGNLFPLRDVNDLYSTQLTSGYFAEFVKSGQPNPSEDYLTVRGYDTSLAAIKETGPWSTVNSDKGPMKLLDYPSYTDNFQEQPQCAFLNYSISYYLDGGL
ncbi:esterase/lipase [Xylogone sp. PMI_703]|nr:esterase/lipase [Xylogone sp. PMI_703]